MLKLKDPVKILSNPDRPNIKITVNERPPSQQQQDHLDKILLDIAKELKENPTTYPITLFYTDTSVISYSYWFMEDYLGDQQYIGPKEPENRIFAQYHAEYTAKMKKHTISELCNPNSKIRLVFATVSLGMGLNAKHIRHIIHYKPPTSLEKYFQEIGRAGRDMQPARATLYFNNTDVRANRPGMTSSMREYCKQKTKCRRKFLLNYFGAELQNPIAECCDICDNGEQSEEQDMITMSDIFA